LKVGGSRSRKGLEVEFRDILVECLKSQPDFAGAVENRDLFERLRSKAQEMRRSDLETLIDLYLSEAEDQIPVVFCFLRIRASATRSQSGYTEAFGASLKACKPCAHNGIMAWADAG
jgi:hypothetical protein